MNLLELAKQDGFNPVIISGDELHGACLLCGGKDRFIIKGDKYICRKADCELNNNGHYGDVIDYLRKYRKLSYNEACKIVGKEPSYKNGYKGSGAQKKEVEKWQPKEAQLSSDKWQEKALSFVEWSFEN